jgi:hypothetical protein
VAIDINALRPYLTTKAGYGLKFQINGEHLYLNTIKIFEELNSSDTNEPPIKEILKEVVFVLDDVDIVPAIER